MRAALHPAAASTAATLALALATGSGTAMAAPPTCEPAGEVSSGAFGIGLLAAASVDGTRNALVSPLGIGAVLEMLAPGAKSPVRLSIRRMFEPGGGGPGRIEAGTDVANGGGPDGSGLGLAGERSCRLAWVLHDASGDAVKVQVANGAFADRRLDLFPAYSETLRAEFEARVERLDFKDERSVGRINAWVSEATGGAIPRLVSRLDPDDVLVLANAIRFEGEWAQPFDPERTVPAPFHLRSGAAHETPRHARGRPAGPVPRGRGLPGRRPSLRRGTLRIRGGAAAGRARSARGAAPAGGGPLVAGRTGLPQSPRRALILPRLALDAEASLLPALRTLGLGAALDDPQAFAGIAAPAPKLSRVLHRTMLVLDEQGTEAAAATAAIMTTRSAMIEEERTFEMRVDRPFALAVRHRATGAVLFTAWVDDPTAGGTLKCPTGGPPDRRPNDGTRGFRDSLRLDGGT